MPRVVIPLTLRKYADDQREVIIDADTLQEAMDRLFQRYPEFDTMNGGPAILSVCINNTLISTGIDEWDQLSLNKDDEIALIIPIAGG